VKIVICGSSKYRVQKVGLLEKIKETGHQPIIDPWSIKLARGQEKRLLKSIKTEPAEVKKKYDFIRWYYNAIKDSDAVIIFNPANHGIENYIGANTFLEIGYAHALNKKVFLYYGMPDQKYILDEISAMEPVVLNGNLEF